MSRHIPFLPALLGVIMLSPVALARAEDGGRMLFDFSRPGASEGWQSVADRATGNKSNGRCTITESGTMEFSGTLSPENNVGFASVRSGRRNLGLETGNTLLLRLRGDGREYRLNLFAPALQTGFAYRASLPTRAGEWVEVRLPMKDVEATQFGRKLSDAAPVDPRKVDAIGFMVRDGKPGPFKLELAWIKVLSASSPTSGPEPTTRSFTYKTISGVALEMIVHEPAGWKASDRRPAIVFFFGGGWENGTIQAFQPQADHLARRGMVAARADYRVKSRQGVNPDKCVEDAKSAVRWLRANAAKLGIDPDRIVASGGSAGGHIAACTALTDGLEADGEDRSISSRPNVLVLFNPVLRFHPLPAMMKRVDNDEAIAKAISPTLHVSKTTPPTLLFFGTDDWLIGQGREFMKRAKEVGFRAEMFTAPGAGHGFFHQPAWYSKTITRMDEFLASLGYLHAEETANSPKP